MFAGVILAFGANVLCQDVTDTYTLYSGGLVYSEGISYDRTTQRITLSSVASDMFSQFDAADNMSHIQDYPFADDDTNFSTGLGVRADPNDTSIFWVAQVNSIQTKERSRVAAYQLHEATSESDASAELLIGHEGVLAANVSQIQFNDLCVSPDGDVYVTESIGSSVQVVMGSDAAAGTAGTLSTLASGDVIGDYDGATHGNGIVYVEHADGDFLLASNYAGEKLVKVDVATGMQTEVLVNASFEGDGFVMLPDGRLVVVTSATVYLLQADTSAWTSATVQYSVELSLSGQLSATTATLADTDLSVFVTTMNWVGAFYAPSTAGSTMLRVEFPSLTTMSNDSSDDATDESNDANNDSSDDATDESNNESTDANNDSSDDATDESNTESTDANNDSSDDTTDESNNESTNESTDDSNYTTTEEPFVSSSKVATAFVLSVVGCYLI